MSTAEVTPIIDPAALRTNSRIPGFYKMSVEERVELLVQRGAIDAEQASLLLDRKGGLPIETANQMIENAIGVLELPLGLGLNFNINGRDYLVPMAVEEPSVLAAVSHVAKIVRGTSHGFTANCDNPLMIGQIQVVGCDDWDSAAAAVLAQKDRLLALANTFEPNMVARGGGAKDVDVRIIDEGKYQKMLVVHLLIDTCDAMGANMINTMAEGIAGEVEDITGGRVFLRILSNLADKRLAKARCKIPFADLAWRGFTGERVAEGVALASEFAEVDPHRACTHNKGIMNGISSVCIASGNDWRAIEAGAHAYAARDGKYGPLAVWFVEDGHLVGEIEVPMQVGTVGGPIRLHPTVQLVHEILDIDGADELAGIMAAVGLAQNMAALKALATEGIQRGHMSLHARTVAATAGAEEDELDTVVEKLIAGGDIKVHTAKAIITRLRNA
jgi:hydroxymethylglutaryl-CoA reductase